MHQGQNRLKRERARRSSSTSPARVCGGKDYDVVLEAQYENEKDVDLIQKFRASGDELLIDRLVKCRNCGLQYISPRLRGDLIFSSYAEGEDPVYVSQMEARERTFAASLAQIEKLVGRPGTTPRHRHGGGRFSSGRDAAWLASRRVRAESLARGLGIEAVRRPHSAGKRLRAELRTGELRRCHALGRHRAHDQPARDHRALPQPAEARRRAGRQLPRHRQLDRARPRAPLAVSHLGAPALLRPRHDETAFSNRPVSRSSPSARTSSGSSSTTSSREARC